MDPGQAVVTKDRVTASADRFVEVDDVALVDFFQGVLPPELKQQIAALHVLLDGLCGQESLELRRRLEGGFYFFARAAAGEPAALGDFAGWDDVDSLEHLFISDLLSAMRNGHYKLLGQQEWEGALCEHFSFYLPMRVDYTAMDSGLLSRFWARHGSEERLDAPPQLADRCLIFYRGVTQADMVGDFYMLKAEYLTNFFIVQPVLAAVTRLGSLTKISPLADLGAVAKTQLLNFSSLFRPPEAAAAPKAHAAGEAADGSPPTEAEGELASAMAPNQEVSAADEEAISGSHRHSVTVERRTFAQVFPDGWSVLKQLFQKVQLQEACFKDVVILYRQAFDNAGEVEGNEGFRLEEQKGQAFLARNMHIKHFKSIPLADLELVLPEKKIFVPPTVLLQLAVTAVLGTVAVLSTLRQGHLNLSVLYSAVAAFVSHALKIYSGTNNERNTIERQMSKMLYNHSAGSQEAVLHTIAEEMRKQRVRELFLCYCVLLHSTQPMTERQLDTACEQLLARKFGLEIDFSTEHALPSLKDWGLVSEGDGGVFQVVQPSEALDKLNGLWDNWFAFKKQLQQASFSNGSEPAPTSGNGSHSQGSWQAQPQPLPQPQAVSSAGQTVRGAWRPRPRHFAAGRGALRRGPQQRAAAPALRGAARPLLRLAC